MDDTTRAIETLIRESSEGLTLQEIAHNDKFRRVQTKDIQQKINLLRSKGRITQQKNSVPPRFIHDNRSLHAVITDVFLSATESPRMMGDENWGSKRALTSENDDNSDEDTEAEENNRSDKTTEEEDRDEEEDHDRVNDDDFENNVDADNGDRERQLESGEEENESEKSLNQQQVTGRQRTRTQELEIIAEQCLTNRIELIPSNVLLQVIKSKKSTEKIERTLEQCNGVQLKKWASDCCKSRRRLRNGKSFQNSLVEEQRAYIKLFLEVRHADMNREGTIWKPGPNLTEQVELLSIDTDEIATIEPINTAIENHWLQKIGKQPSSKKAAVRHSKKPKHKLVNIHSLGSFRSRRENNTLEGKMRKDSQWGVSIDQRSSDEIIGLNGLAEVFRSQGYKFVAPESNPREDSEPPEHESRATNVNTTIINFTFNSDKSGRVVTASQHIPQTAAINTVEDVESDHDSDKESTETDFELAISGITYKVKESHLVKPSDCIKIGLMRQRK
ncbi:hypothetical protein BCR33DRAFT_366213 [Rhizoclosmatium globosum]|uniref:Uncharacterized protein n=1 Tax=Rhizoclosmatium globosum TaxID=329046 RepID=A0A1Y2C2D0_9FUNG|nr:hypothetical protein BCR33DRAFT_366213 [Rhizoclosmatium globosum]|eukprot:ORY40475.1 hypothetical protein BCR33DRAFT_366213 [Rhizoclosmatium globosum]